MGPIGKEAKISDQCSERSGEVGVVISLSPTHILVRFADGTETWIPTKHIVGVRAKDHQ